MVKVQVSEIHVSNRFRKDLGDIKSLANSIAKLGLMHPIVVRNGKVHNHNHSYQLIAGERRLEVCKKLGLKEIPVTVLDMEEIIIGELHENIARKDFTMSERHAIEEEIQKNRIGHRLSTKRVSNLSPFQTGYKGRKTRNILAEYTGISEAQLSKEKYIIEAAKENPGD